MKSSSILSLIRKVLVFCIRNGFSFFTLQFDDLNEAMNKLEHWAHRLFPQMPFDEILARLENLGSKRLVQVRINRKIC